MIISRTPFRMSFFGGGTDYPIWYREHGGQTLAATIDKYCYLTCRYLPPFFEHRFRVIYSKIETCQRPDEIAHPAVRAILQYLKIDQGLEIHHDGDLPARSGMGSSSSFTVGLLHALHALLGRMVSRHDLAMQGIHVEQELLRETVGSQDQVMAAYGGLNHVRFLPSGEIVVQPIVMSPARFDAFNEHLMLFFTGISRMSTSVASSYAGNLLDKEATLGRMSEMVEEGIDRLVDERSDFTGFGRLLHDAWKAKRGLSNAVTNDRINGLYDAAIKAGAIGGKLLGAGGGGFLMFVVPPDRQENVRAALGRSIHVPVRLESAGSQLIFYNRETDYQRADRVRCDQTIDAFTELDFSCPEQDPVAGEPFPQPTV